MKLGTHNLGHNAFSDMTIVKIEAGALIIRQVGRTFSEQKITLSREQAQLLGGLIECPGD